MDLNLAQWFEFWEQQQRRWQNATVWYIYWKLSFGEIDTSSLEIHVWRSVNFGLLCAELFEAQDNGWGVVNELGGEKVIWMEVNGRNNVLTQSTQPSPTNKDIVSVVSFFDVSS